MPERSPVLHLAPGLAIPAEEFIESRTAFVAKSGSGKTGAVKVLEEELFRVGLPFITFDPVGVHWGIRSSFDGKGPGLPVLIIGGDHRDVELNRKAGRETCRAILEANVSAVIDFKGEPKSAYREFVRDFAQELLAHNATSRVVILEEAKELVPQKPRPDMAEVYDAVERLVSQGRNMGIGVVLVGQRPATINKDVLTQIDTMFVGRVIGLPDRKALREWVEAIGDEEKWDKFSESLATLPTRTMWAWSPELLKLFKEVRFNDFTTLHADRTHLRRLGLIEQKVTTTDVSGIVAKLGKEVQRIQVEKVAAADVPKLRRRVEQLQEELAAARSQAATKVAPDPKAIERALDARDRAWRAKLSAYARGVKGALAARTASSTAASASLNSSVSRA